MSSDADSDYECQLTNDIGEEPSSRRLTPLFEDLSERLHDSVSESGSGWARKRRKIAFKLHNSLLQLTHWNSDIRNDADATLRKVEAENEAFAYAIRTELLSARTYLRGLQSFVSTANFGRTLSNTEFEDTLVESIQIAIKRLQMHVDPLRAFLDAREGVGMAATIKNFFESNREAATSPCLDMDFAEDQTSKGESMLQSTQTTETFTTDDSVADILRFSALTNFRDKRF